MAMKEINFNESLIINIFIVLYTEIGCFRMQDMFGSRTLMFHSFLFDYHYASGNMFRILYRIST